MQQMEQCIQPHPLVSSYISMTDGKAPIKFIPLKKKNHQIQIKFKKDITWFLFQLLMHMMTVPSIYNQVHSDI